MDGRLSPADLASLELEENSRLEEERRKDTRPSIDEQTARSLAWEFFRKGASEVKKLDSYDDNNFRLDTEDGETFTLKVHNASDSQSEGLITALNHISIFCSEKGFAVPAPLRARGGATFAAVPLPIAGGQGEELLAVRCLTWVDGPMMVSSDVTPELMVKAGEYLGRLGVELGSFYDKALLRRHPWDLKNTGALSGYVQYLQDTRERALVETVIEAFRTTVVTTSAHFRHGVIHGDFNDANVVLSADGNEVAGVIDFGDAAHTWIINDVAIAMAYAMLSPLAKKTGDPLAAAALLLKGFTSVKALLPAESRHLRVLVACRLAASVTMGAYTQAKFPDNEYLKLHSQPSWQALRLIWNEIPEEHAKALWEKAMMQVSIDVIMKVSSALLTVSGIIYRA